MVVRRLAGRLLLALATLAACSVGRDSTSFSNAGSLCFKSLPHGNVKVQVLFPSCFSSSCTKVVAAVCSIKEQDGVIKVSSYGEFAFEGSSCTDDCNSFSARCQSVPLDAGDYLLTYGDQSATITLPATQEVRFLSDANFDPCAGL